MTDLQFHKKIEGINSYLIYIVLVPLFLITEDAIIKNEIFRTLLQLLTLSLITSKCDTI